MGKETADTNVFTRSASALVAVGTDALVAVGIHCNPILLSAQNSDHNNLDTALVPPAHKSAWEKVKRHNLG